MARLIVTRPAQQAQAWVQALCAMGHEAVTLPLIEIASLSLDADIAALHRAQASLAHFDALMFVSSAAVQAFFKPVQTGVSGGADLSTVQQIAQLAPKLRIWVTGPGTLASLRELGIAPARIDAPPAQAEQFDSEALWQCVQAQVHPASQVLIVRGRDVGEADRSRDWLAQQIIAKGAAAQTVVAYERRAPHWSIQGKAQCATWLRDGSIWLFSSSQAVHHLPPELQVDRARCICTHERIAQAARERGFNVVCTSRPTVSAVAASIKSINE